MTKKHVPLGSLHTAVEEKNLKKVKSLLGQGVKIDEINKQNKTPLDVAKTNQLYDIEDVINEEIGWRGLKKGTQVGTISFFTFALIAGGTIGYFEFELDAFENTPLGFKWTSILTGVGILILSGIIGHIAQRYTEYKLENPDRHVGNPEIYVNPSHLNRHLERQYIENHK